VPDDQMMLDRHPLVHEPAPDDDPAPGEDDAPGREHVLDQEDALDVSDALDAGDAAGSDEEPAPDYPDPPRTGDPAVDEVIDAVARAVGGPLEEQLAVYDAAYRTLQDRLADVEG